MSRMKLSEYRAKSLLIPNYKGMPVSGTNTAKDAHVTNDDTRYIVKVDQGIKKRGKQGLIELNVSTAEINAACERLSKKGFSRFIAEPMYPHDDNEERYVSFERTREGVQVLYSEKGGIEVEDSPESIKHYSVNDVPLPSVFISHVLEVMNTEHMSFVEINPLIVRNDECVLLDAAVLVDSAGEHAASWNDNDIVEARTFTTEELAVAELNNNSPAAFSLRILNPDGALWLLLSGGGASITLADEASNQGKAHLIGNYGEYSGGPSTEETYLYTKAVLSAALQSQAKRKAIIVAGGVANFTDVKKTFSGVIRAISENIDAMREQSINVYVRRGGPNETEGLQMMADFLKQHNILGSVHGSDDVLTVVIHEALEDIDA